MQVTTNPTALPGSCLFCPGSARERYIVTDLSLDYYGAVYICDQCVVSMGRMLGMGTATDMEVLEAAAKVLQKHVYELKRKVAGLEAVVHGMADAGLISVPERGDSPVLPPDAAGQGDVAENPGGGFREEGDRVGTGAGTAPEPSDDESLAGLHTDDKHDGSFRLRV